MFLLNVRGFLDECRKEIILKWNVEAAHKNPASNRRLFEKQASPFFGRTDHDRGNLD